MAPIEFIGRYMDGFFDYGIADEVHELKSGETAQGNALGTLASACDRTVVLTGTLLGGYADELFRPPGNSCLKSTARPPAATQGDIRRFM